MSRILILFLAGLLTACSDKGDTNVQSSSAPSVELPNMQKNLQLKFLNAKPGDVITIPAGRFEFQRSLSLKVDGVTVRGAGMDKTILDFKNQISGAEGILVTANDFTIEDLAIEDAKGDALKINDGKNIVIRRVRTEWTNGPDTNNGAYGIYPVQTENTLIEGAIAIGASDAGIYVGQSRNVVVRDSRAEYNVAGIEIENTVDADVYNNVATNNTGGILVFNMPNLSLEGVRTRIYNNQIVDNNTANFAAPGGAVAGVPAGSGISINSNDLVEVFDNDLKNNQTAHIVISSVYSTNYSDRENASSFDPYPEKISIHDNRYEGGGNDPDTNYLPQLKNAVFGEEGSFPNVIWDGFVNPELVVDGKLPAEYQICIYNEASSAIFNVDAPNRFASPRVNETDHQCQHSPLPAVQLERL
ncbi:MAG: parallel beta-helix domain-containing protein [Pseudomonadales bacterium]|nr:parallel beta-helix domain-containing protein [Pseudomonadales bacterium]